MQSHRERIFKVTTCVTSGTGSAAGLTLKAVTHLALGRIESQPGRCWRYLCGHCATPVDAPPIVFTPVTEAECPFISRQRVAIGAGPRQDVQAIPVRLGLSREEAGKEQYGAVARPGKSAAEIGNPVSASASRGLRRIAGIPGRDPVPAGVGLRRAPS